MSLEHFPQGLAKGDNFIGREEDITWLQQNIKTGQHTLILAPRRYGKTSLTQYTLSKQHLPFAEINLFLTTSGEALQKKIIHAVQTLLKQLSSSPEKLLGTLQKFFKHHSQHWTIGLKGVFGLELIPEKQEDSPENILTALKLLESVLATKKQRAVIFIDEIQETGLLPDGKQITGAIRTFAEDSKHLVFIFSGSNRRMLMQLFDDKSMPLYELCDRIILGKISEEAYRKYLNKVYKKTFSGKLNEEVLQKILSISERHPKRVYSLCFYLWRLNQNKKQLTVDAVEKAWTYYLEKRLKDIRYYLSLCSHGQIKVLTLIACGHNKEMTGQIAQRRVAMAGPTITKTLQILTEKDLIERHANNSYLLIDPLIKDILKNYESENLNLS